ncbi:Caffeic acid 3-O-methyltransferase [Sesamum alatum]|uniref:Caffeic acid 3-O-methyltransferase n=1 Tax=Sesamum alatum TaxID=300844 RepID=A0AAE1YGM6_9LAMI|nr:Caffeic acid 3-O-methyltransferase [Sesamum alatum]
MQESSYINDYNPGEDDEAGVLAFAACVSHVFPMALDAAIQLDLFEIIARAGGGAQLSPSDIMSQLPASNDGAAAVLDSLLRLLTTHSLLTCSVSRVESGGIERRYGVASAGKFFVGDENGVSLAPLRASVVATRGPMSEFSIQDAILKGGNFTEKVYGKSAYELLISKPETSKIFNNAMRARSTVQMKKAIKIYDGFTSLGSIVDVGGGTGTALAIIIANCPSIRGINFDLPQVVQNAPSYNGIEHIGGDMFVEIPRGDAILLKYILHNWDDENCNKLMKNCYTALPNKGKLILMDYILPTCPQTDDHSKYVSVMNILMSTMMEGKERTEDEFKGLAAKVGFTEFKVVCYVYGMSIMELIKSV